MSCVSFFGTVAAVGALALLVYVLAGTIIERMREPRDDDEIFREKL